LDNRELESLGAFIATSFAIRGGAGVDRRRDRRFPFLVDRARDGRRLTCRSRAKLFDKAAVRSYCFRNTVRIFPSLVFYLFMKPPVSTWNDSKEIYLRMI
jgi:hypothetical protein